MTDPAPKGSMIAGAKRAIAASPGMALAVIVALLVVAVGLYAYYHGIGPLGPHKGKQSRLGASAPPPVAASDPEAERLISALNTPPGGPAH
jgi:hypothetical protein